MTTKKKDGAEETEQFLLRPRKELLKRLTDAANGAQRFVTRNQVALEILERYLPLWEEIERQLEAAVEAQYARVTLFSVQSEPAAPAGRVVPDIHGALASEIDEVGPTETATAEQVREAERAKPKKRVPKARARKR